MKIELWYDAVVQEIDIIINDNPVNKNDIYGFLYSVRNYPIQSWLYSNGSWKGIEYQIMELARDEKVYLTFYGRQCDYNDLNMCLSKNDKINLKFSHWDICSRYEKIFSKLLSVLKTNDDIIKNLLLCLKLNFKYNIDFNISTDDNDCIYHVYNDLDLTRDIEDKRCYVVHNSYFTSYDKLQNLLYLTRSLKIPSDAIYCSFKNKKTKENYKYYAKAFKKINFKFYLENEKYISDIKTKYGIPYVIKSNIKQTSKLLKQLSDIYLNLRDFTKDEFNKLSKDITSLSEDQQKRYDNIKKLRDCIYIFNYGMEFIYNYIDVMLSVSKENKEEIFHYECIDKLEENINLYLKSDNI